MVSKKKKKTSVLQHDHPIMEAFFTLRMQLLSELLKAAYSSNVIIGHICLEKQMP